MDNENYRGITVKVDARPDTTTDASGEIAKEFAYIQGRIDSLDGVASRLRNRLIPVMHRQATQSNTTMTEESEIEAGGGRNSPLGVALFQISQDLDDLFMYLTRIVDNLEL